MDVEKNSVEEDSVQIEVFTFPDILEEILMHLPLRDIFLWLTISKSICSVIGKTKCTDYKNLDKHLNKFTDKLTAINYH